LARAASDARAQSVESLATVAGRLPEIVSDPYAANRARWRSRVLWRSSTRFRTCAIELARASFQLPETDWWRSRSAARPAGSHPASGRRARSLQ
jgi:hypothetical protein